MARGAGTDQALPRNTFFADGRIASGDVIYCLAAGAISIVHFA